MRIPFLAAAAGAIALLSSHPAAANGRFPASNQIVFSPTDPNLVIARTTYGILPSHDNGATWSYLCEDVLGLPNTAFYDPELGLTAGNALVASVPEPYEGLDVSPDVGCSWSCAGGPLAGQSFADNVVRPDKPHVVLAITSTQTPTDAGVSLYGTQVFQSTDDGATWAPLGVPLDSHVLVQTIDVSKADAQGNYSIYVSGTRGYGSARTASLFASVDLGQTWVEHPLQAFDAATEDSIYIGGVDPTDPKRVYLRSSSVQAAGRSRLFMTTDGGGTFTSPKTFQIPMASIYAVTGEFLGFALSADGSKIYAGTKEDGLFVASRTDMVFNKTSSIHVQCLATRGQELWVCSDEASTSLIGTQFVIGVTTDDGAHFTSKLPTISTLCGPLACPASTSTSFGCRSTVSGGQCQASFDTFCQQNDVEMQCGKCGGDAGAPPGDGGTTGDGGTAAVEAGAAKPASSASSSSSCAVSAPGGGGGGAGLAAAFAAMAFARGRRRRRP